ncbi:ester cyclase [Planotetraspora sp. GP83]|uniref:ester cyclase n=1 Tax=Planotetraspora sp. GP83 TaxID=3156264 RepID=UPI00351855F5
MSAERSREVMRLYVEEVLGKGKVELLDDIADPDVVDHAAIRYGWRQGIDGWHDHVRHFLVGVSDLRVTLDNVVATRSRVVGVWTFTAVHSGLYIGIPATGRTITGTAASIFTLRDGKVVDYAVVSDHGAVRAQMGVDDPASAG